MTKPIHTSGPLYLNQSESNGDDLISLDSEERHITLHMVEAPEDIANSRLLAAAYNAFDSAAKKLGMNAVELSERMHDGEIADLASVLLDIIAEADGGWLRESPIANRARAILAKVKGGAA